MGFTPLLSQVTHEEDTLRSLRLPSSSALGPVRTLESRNWMSLPSVYMGQHNKGWCPWALLSFQTRLSTLVLGLSTAHYPETPAVRDPQVAVNGGRGRTLPNNTYKAPGVRLSSELIRFESSAWVQWGDGSPWEAFSIDKCPMWTCSLILHYRKQINK